MNLLKNCQFMQELNFYFQNLDQKWENTKKFEEISKNAISQNIVTEIIPFYGKEAKRGSFNGKNHILCFQNKKAIKHFNSILIKQFPMNSIKIKNAVEIQPHLIKNNFQGTGTVKFQTGSPGRFARLSLGIKPSQEKYLNICYELILERFEKDLDFDGYGKTSTHNINKYLSQIIMGIKTACKISACIGKPVLFADIDVTDFFWHPVDSHPKDFMFAAYLAVQNALKTIFSLNNVPQNHISNENQ